jgi:hypothetical protein
VDFQPSGFAKATYLNVFVHWLWRLGADPLTGQSMDYGNRVPGAGAFFKDEQQWSAVVERVVSRAVEEAHRLRATVPDLAAAARVCVEEEELRIADIAGRDGIDRDQVVSGWGAWHAAVASGLVGQTDAAEHYFARITRFADDRAHFAPYRDRALRWQLLARQDHGLFVREVTEDVNAQRKRLKLPPVLTPTRGGTTEG